MGEERFASQEDHKDISDEKFASREGHHDISDKKIASQEDHQGNSDEKFASQEGSHCDHCRDYKDCLRHMELQTPCDYKDQEDEAEGEDTRLLLSGKRKKKSKEGKD